MLYCKLHDTRSFASPNLKTASSCHISSGCDLVVWQPTCKSIIIMHDFIGMLAKVDLITEL